MNQDFYTRHLFVKDGKVVGNVWISDDSLERIKEYRNEHYPETNIFKEVEEN